ncbi:MAG: hypothetical protein KGJ97_10430 [Xanthomonadaceae bacterium]|nr:hypothetical protein [Xanthomonadaceae bacterium]
MKSHTSHLGIALIIAGLSIGMIAHAAEPPRDLRRLQLLREWSHEQVYEVFP